MNNGCQLVRHGGNHDKWYSPKTGLFDYVPRHGSQELPVGMERKLRKRLLGE
ncbi:MAG: type II toxin-antitoxin system HicA family toxin [Prevotellaceae bacterium]|nr:type II toxin-antitoxin system HicA family toxin [Prevotellaceae bacterium]